MDWSWLAEDEGDEELNCGQVTKKAWDGIYFGDGIKGVRIADIDHLSEDFDFGPSNKVTKTFGDWDASLTSRKF